jgi:2-polyprenyl-3-methyl-5-hydroxy-6-metoxy-1,4-benzoquinol methylase
MMDLVEYYNVSPEEAEILGTRATGRKPSFPASLTCDAVSGKTWEELWHDKPRETTEQRLNFYKDIGAWSAFRQVLYRRDFNYGYFYNKFCTVNSSILEYGCGVAPMANFLLDRMASDKHNTRFTLVDVTSEHFEFAKWRIEKKASNVRVEFIDITLENMVPSFSSKFDFVCIMDVFEHLPNPVNVLKAIYSCCNPGCHLVETWIDHKPTDVGEDDLVSAAEQRDEWLKLLREKFDLIENLEPIRIWRKK